MDVMTYFQFVAALAFVLGLIAVLTWAVKRSGFAGQMLPNARKNQADRRLSVSEVLSLDSRRKLVLLKCDDQEHLLLVNQGQGGDLLIDKMPAKDGPEETSIPEGNTLVRAFRMVKDGQAETKTADSGTSDTHSKEKAQNR
ncbi:FliO/MopB family protein [Rhodovibrionaceae bacterium A322]